MVVKEGWFCHGPLVWRRNSMPKSKRNRVVTLAKVDKKGRERKEGLVNSVGECLDQYKALYLFRYENMRNDKFKELREKCRDTSRFFLGSNKVLQIALGKSEAEEPRDNTHRVAERLKGFCGLFFTNMEQEEVEQVFAEFEELDYARTGMVAPETIQMDAGPIHGPMGPIAHTMEPTLRENGMPTKLNKGIVELVSDFQLCKEGQQLSPEQVVLLRLFDHKLAKFKLQLDCMWTTKEFKLL
mmetsp:Transcript_11576/g.71202  ORF Transcript_11576/g.71202 Transcript_11576/m.71202 type:complete len:241 (-) Transcript_11576:2577-3299(-)